ncbi:MAG: S-layer homology domain-containing protein [Ruminiclostridium sp.]|nr:S-layer homology domain-containing protein [Ruminiclostridium sp.]
MVHCSDIEYHINIDTTDSTNAISALRSYASAVGRPVYSYNDVTTVLSADQMDQIAKLLAKELKGEIGEVYRLSDDLLYIVLYVDGEVSGCATVKQTLTDGKAGFRLVSATEDAAPESDLQAQVQEDQTQSNITLDYSDAGSDKSAYLTDALNNIDGTAVNDAAKGEIAAYVETAVSEASVTDVKCRKNAAVLTDKTIQESLTQAEREKAALDKALDGVELNKSLTIVLRVVCTNLTEGQPVQVTFEPSMLEAMADAQAVQVILGDGQHSVTISAEALTALCQTHGKLTVLLQRTEDGAYTITLLDDQDQVIPKTEEALTFTLPAESPNATVLASYEGGSDNWGGQYDSINGAIEFMTPYSGTYEVMENQVDINDLADCDEETAEAIRFMVSRGYFDLTDGSFDPDGTLNRYAFAQALVKMFFALDRSLTTSFSDVPADSEYYPYVASGEQDAIIEGFQDGTFRGENDVLVEQVIALCSRTLADKKGYTYPENPVDYLKFVDADEISDWALETTALAVRESLIEGTGVLGPQDPISRGDAARMLYRLFMLLYEPPAAEITVVDTSSDVPVLPIALGVAAVAAVGAGAVIWKTKKPPANRKPN